MINTSNANARIMACSAFLKGAQLTTVVHTTQDYIQAIILSR